ncbi:hypothetical protein [Kitasatospora sp. NPDC085879]|uniref:hypothetical protein n=1 Tax=Kitasatospora sp. NPDC085879 TaxID=3154769 RepID=UPI003446125D
MIQPSVRRTHPRTARRTALSGLAAAALACATVPPAAADQGAPLPPPAQIGKFVPTGPTRILDTRTAVGVPAAHPVGPGGSIRVPVGVPSGAKAVVMNVTAINPTADGFVTVHPDGTARPGTSNLNFRAGQTVPNLVTVPVSNGYVDFYNLRGTTDIAADLAGYYTDDPAVPGSSFQPLSPARLLDTRTSTDDRAKAPIHAGATLRLQVAGRGGVPAGATGVVMNVTATGSSSGGYLTVFPHGTPRPATSNLNFVAGQTVPNLVTVPLGADGSVDLYNFLGDVDAVADVFGYYESAPTGAGFVPLTPGRVLDTRDGTGTGGVVQRVGSGRHVSLRVSGANGIPMTGPAAVVLNVTAVRPSAAGYLAVGPSLEPRPATSNLNFTADQTVSNLVVARIGRNGFVDFYNNSGDVDVVADVFGYFQLPTHGPTDLGFPLPYQGVPNCTSTPGVLQPRYLSPTDRAFNLTAQFFPVPGATAPQRGRFVLTGPEGSTVVDTAEGTGHLQGVAHNLTPGATYTWYAYATDGEHSSEPSYPCSFRVGTDAVPEPPDVTADPQSYPIHVGDTVKFTITERIVSPADRDRVASFRYCVVKASCATVQAVDGRATFTHTVTDRYDLIVGATATSVAGVSGLSSSSGWGVVPDPE